MKRFPRLSRDDIFDLDPVWVQDVLNSPDWETDDKGRLLFQVQPQARSASGKPLKSYMERRRDKHRRRGIPEHLIDAEIRKADEKMAELYRQAGIDLGEVSGGAGKPRVPRNGR